MWWIDPASTLVVCGWKDPVPDLLTLMKGVKKANLPQKLCIVCGRLFTWRKKWERVWAAVKFCSDRCRMRKGAKGEVVDKK